MTKGVDIFEKILINGVEVDISQIDARDGKWYLPTGNNNVEYVLKVKHTIPDNLFNGIESLVDVSLPKLITTIGKDTFANTGITNQETIDIIHNINEDAIVGENEYYYGVYAGTESHFNTTSLQNGTYPISLKDTNGLNMCNSLSDINNISLGNSNYTYLIVPKDFYDTSYANLNAAFTDGTNHYTLGDDLTDMSILSNNVFNLGMYEGHEYYAILWFNVSGNVWFKRV